MSIKDIKKDEVRGFKISGDAISEREDACLPPPYLLYEETRQLFAQSSVVLTISLT